MTLVVSDTGPINYLTLIGHVGILPALFEQVIVPGVVFQELIHPNTPDVVRQVMLSQPEWLITREPRTLGVLQLDHPSLDQGELAAMQLASELGTDLLLMDDRAGAKAARDLGFAVTGTLGVLYLAAERGMLDLRTAFGLLRQTSFRCPDAIMDDLLNRFEAKPR